MIKLRKKQISNNKFSLYLDIYENGNRRYEFLKLYLNNDKLQNKEIMKLAEGIRAKRELQLRSDEYGFIPDFKKRTNFIDYMKTVANTKEKGNKNMFQNTINYVEAYSGKNITINQINEIWLKGFENHMRGKLSNNSIVNYMRIISVTLNQAIKDKIITINPFRFFNTKVKAQETNKEYLTIEEMRKLSETPCSSDEVKRAFLFACYTGLRISDIKNLKWENIKEDNLELRIVKTKRIQNIPLSDTAKELLYKNKIIEMNDEKVFNLPHLTTIHRQIQWWVKTSGIKKHITSHTARHTFATLSLTMGVDLYTVSKLLGHSDVKTTQIYAKIIDEKKVEAVHKLPKLNFI